MVLKKKKKLKAEAVAEAEAEGKKYNQFNFMFGRVFIKTALQKNVFE